MLKNLKKLFALLTFQEKTGAILLLIMISFVNLFEVIGITSIYPLLKIISDPTTIETIIYLNAIYQELVEFGINDKDQFIFFFGIGVIIIAHRLESLSNCDIIFKLKNGKIENKRKFKDIVKIN